MKVLGIESSCDECSASVVEVDVQSNGGWPHAEVLSLCTYSQIELHQPFGGVVPEVASRSHLEQINEVVAKALNESGSAGPSDVDLIAVTNRPGLVGALLVGVTAAKSLAYAWKKPLVPVHHLEGHALSSFLHAPSAGQSAAAQWDLPTVLAIVSGGHTSLYAVDRAPAEWDRDFLSKKLIGRSLDDAAGEAFDKTAKILGFPYPGGVWLDRGSEGGDPRSFEFPRALGNSKSLDFSFSGLKTAVSLRAGKHLEELKNRDSQLLKDFCASVQEAIVDALVTKIWRACEMSGARSVVLVGGVAANRRLRARLNSEYGKYLTQPPTFPALAYCGDNGAMIACAGAVRAAQGGALVYPDYLTLNAWATAQT